MNATEPIPLERTYQASAATIWELWTTAKGIESWWAPDGYVTEVRKLDLRPGGVMAMELLHDQVWTERLVAGRTNELDNLATVISERKQA